MGVAGEEQRRSPRYEAGLPVICRAATSPEEGIPSLIGMTWNVSQGGLEAELPAAPPEGTLDLLLRVGDRAVAARGRVAWLRPTAEGVRCGFAFTGMEPIYATVWEAFLAQQGGPTPRRYVRLNIDLPITCRPLGVPGVVLTGRLGNISDGGMLVRLPAPMEPAQEVEVSLTSPQTPLTVTAAVAWTDGAPLPDGAGLIRHGLRFVPPSGAGACRLDLFLVRALIAEYLRQTRAAPAE
ncbi:MAG: PilZ domain-containing protein [candidate division NC10 bacterium]|nr:PilZ domain-containing protein [candidate division NC10 bacterium]MBI4391868.1 PilZ domain-containing protein [candidate division NC10 bacterium]